MAVAQNKLDINKLLKHGAPKKFLKGELIFREGAVGDEMYIILKGSVEVSTGTTKLSVLTPGNFFGEMSLLSDMPRSATIKAVEDSYVLCLNKDNFGHVIKEEPLLAFKIMQTMADRIRRLNFEIKEATKSVKSITSGQGKEMNESLDIQIKERMFLKYAYYGMNDNLTEISKEGLITIDTRDGYGITPLEWCAFTGNVETMQLLLSFGAKIDAKDNAGNTPVILATINGLEDMLKFLIENKADINSKNNLGETAIMYACFYGLMDILKLLISARGDIHKRDDTGATAIMWACATGQIEIVQHLLDCGANLDDRDRMGNTPLLTAIKYGTEDVAMLLLEAEAVFEVIDKEGQTALDSARKHRMDRVIKYIKNKGGLFGAGQELKDDKPGKSGSKKIWNLKS